MSIEPTPEKTPGILLKGDDGTHYFIPKTDLSAYAVGDVPPEVSAAAEGAPGVRQVDAIGAHRVDAAHMPMPEEGSDAAAFMPMTESGSDAAAFMPMTESGSDAAAFMPFPESGARGDDD